MSSFIFCLHRLKAWLFPPVECAENVKSHDNKIVISEEDADIVNQTDEVKRKRHRKEKIGFRDRKVIVSNIVFL